MRDEAIDRVIKDVLPLITPSEEERRKARKAETKLRERLDSVLKNYPGIEYRFLGSYVRDTWLRENLELDVFILFPEETPNEELERIGLEIGKSVVDEWQMHYAAHPYVHGKVEGVEVDIVPCYRLKSAERIKSAVDRTPLHHEWLKDRIRGKENEVRLLKKFLKARNLYGAEYRVKGFSGYLCELLIILYGSFRNTVVNAITWTRNTVIDVANEKIYRKKSFSFFVIDPVDVKRNVAANLSLDNLARFVECCRDFLKNPSIDFFVEKWEREEKRKEVDEGVLRTEIEGRTLYVIEFKKPDIVEDNLFPQLERACKKIYKFLERKKFMPLRSGYFTNDRCYLIFETEVKELSRIERHDGPFFEEAEHVRKFLKKKREYMPFIENGKYFVYVKRRHCKAEDAIAEYIRNRWKSLGKNVGEMLSKEFKILKGEDLLSLSDNFKVFLVDFLSVKNW
jgi:tRNA nucleotidyltransferase (CCA-adding enzyme)